MIGIAVVCFVLAGLITFAKFSGHSGGIESIPEGESTWIKCNNPACQAQYQMGLKDYLKIKKERFNPENPFARPGLTCKECGKDSVYEAVKCGNPDCGKVFFKNSVPGDLADRCPGCGKSEMDELRRKNLDGG